MGTDLCAGESRTLNVVKYDFHPMKVVLCRKESRAGGARNTDVNYFQSAMTNMTNDRGKNTLTNPRQPSYPGLHPALAHANIINNIEGGEWLGKLLHEKRSTSGKLYDESFDKKLPLYLARLDAARGDK